MFSVPGNRRLKDIAKAVFAIMALAFIAHFIFFPLFGLYEDDYIYTLPPMNFSWAEFSRSLVDAWRDPVQARPLNHFLRQIFFFFTVRHGHLAAGFLLNWVLVSANGVILYSVIRRILSHPVALIGALVFVLFPIDTSRQILMIQTDLLVPICLLLVCFHLYLSRRYWMAYVLIGVSMLDLESLFPPFLAAPLLLAGLAGVSSWKSLLKKVIIHGLIMAMIFGLFVVGRIALGEERARSASSNAVDSIVRVVRLGTEGPFHSLIALIQRPLDGAIHCNAALFPYALLAIAVTAWGLSGSLPGRDEPAPDSLGRGQPERRAALYVFIGGLMVWSLGYVLWIPDDYFPPVISIGRMSAEHSAAAIGAGLAAAGVAVWILSLSITPKRLFVLAFSCYCGALVSFAVEIQLTEYVPYWEETKRFWSELLNQIRDIQDGDVVLVEQSDDPRAMPITKGFGEFDEETYLPLALPLFVDFPNTWKQNPRVYGVWNGCGVDDLGDSIKVHTPMWAPTIWPTIHSGSFIYFRVMDGRLERVTGPVTIEGKQLVPKQPSADDLPSLPLSKVYLNLTSPPAIKQWPSLRAAKNYPR
jgi:hypothetical protein